MFKVTRSGALTSNTTSPSRGRGGSIAAILKIIVGLAAAAYCIPEVHCGKVSWKERLPRGLKDLQQEMNRKSSITHPIGYCDFEENCDWSWNQTTGFKRIKGPVRRKHVPIADANNNKDGQFLWFNGRGLAHTWSKYVPPTGTDCVLEVALHQIGMRDGVYRLIVATNTTSWVADEKPGKNFALWEPVHFSVGAISQMFRLYLEVAAPYTNSSVAVDNIRMLQCYPEQRKPHGSGCSEDMFRCKNGTCLNRTRVCDLTKDCAEGEDELVECEKIPEGARCSFEHGWCGWRNVPGRPLNWTLHQGPTPSERTGPTFDHTYRNSSGTYAYVNMSIRPDLSGIYAYVNMSKRSDYGSRATIESPLYNPTPPYSSNPESRYHRSCQVRFFFHQYGVHSGSLGLYLVQVKPHQNHSESLWWSFGDRSDVWYGQAVALPDVRYRFFLQFEASRSYSSKGDVAIDDISLSPECFGIGVPPEVLGTFNYSNPIIDAEIVPEQHTDFVNGTVIRVTTCGATGRLGPTLKQCNEENNTDVEYVIPSSTSDDEETPSIEFEGVQRWTAPRGGYYTIIAMGARGGRGSAGTGSSLGAVVGGVVELEKGQNVYFMVGQAGTDACPKSLGLSMHNCQMSGLPDRYGGGITSIVQEVKKIKLKDGGGGGGGATYVFTMDRDGQQRPLFVAAGGGGLGLGQFTDDGLQHGRGLLTTRKQPTSGMTFVENSGAGGGWDGTWRNTSGVRISTGMPLIYGGLGGFGCGSDNRGYGDGGFGGGGGGCLTGGGGGGYIGGNTGRKEFANGEGGYSFAASELLHVYFLSGTHHGQGEIYIIPAISGCGCDFRCVALDQYLSETKCLCPPGWLLSNDSKSCVMADSSTVSHKTFIILLTIVSIGLLLAFAGLCILLYNRYQNRKALLRRRQVMFGNGTELTALRAVSDNMMTEFNPNYEFAGNLYSFKDLPQIPRDYITLVKPLGQGAFGEVFQGVYKYRRDEHPVAVKTLPSLSTPQAEADFMMEALIMSKFNHPNIVHFIGISFDKHPRYIVLELLAGGDLKNFLREERPRPDRPTPLTMQDLMMCAYDVASGCTYMEEARFIHRDIAARNCLLTCKGPGRVVKIADFGMARDIYRSDYYRKGGKAMLPIKWMPPESFLDGIFTTKTDVWAFGVLLWEIMSFGYMPYTGCANREVMTMVTSGGRLEKPAGCPDQIYGLMTRCWHPNPEERPSFLTLTERIGYCLQDPDVINHPLPNYDILPTYDREITIMRPDPEAECINVSEIDGYMQPRPSTHRSGRYQGNTANRRRSGNPIGGGTSFESVLNRPKDTLKIQSQNFAYKDNSGKGNNDSCVDGNDHGCEEQNCDDSSEERCKNSEDDQAFKVADFDRNQSRNDNGNNESGDSTSQLLGNTDALDVVVDRKNGNESTTTTDTNSDSLLAASSETPPNTTANSSPNTRTCSPSRGAANAGNVNGMLRKSALKAALSLDPSALYRGTIAYEKIGFSNQPQHSSAAGSMDLTKDSLGHQLPREEECSC